jgi:Uma2 family endonuclease
MVMAADSEPELVPEGQARMTVERFEQMIEKGLFDEDERVELLNGYLVEMSPQGEPHAYTIVRLNNLLMRLLAGRAAVAPQVPFVASKYSRPEPDMALWPADFEKRPRPVQPVLVIEVAVSSLRNDRLVKTPIYAKAGMPEYWLVDLRAEVIEVYTQPSPRGYERITTLHRGDVIHLAAFPDVEVAVSDVLPPL